MMTSPLQDWRSALNMCARSLAGSLSPSNPLRRASAQMWGSLLNHTGRYVTLPIQGERVRVLTKYRSLDVNYEARALNSFLRLITPGDIVWDVGANIGIYTVLAGIKVGPSGRVVAWEPSPRTFSLLDDHIRANGLESRCTTFRAAVNDGSKLRIPLMTCEDISIDRVWNGAQLGQKAIVEVEAASLDGWSCRLAHCPSLVKIDIEGAEVLALRGAFKLLRGEMGLRPPMLLAVHPQFLPEFGCRVDDLLRLTADVDYEVYDLEGRRMCTCDYAEYWLVPRGTASRTVALLATNG